MPRAFSNTAGHGHGAAPDHDADSIGFWQRPRYVTEEQQAAAADGDFLLQPTVIAYLKMLHALGALVEHGSLGGASCSDNTLSPLIIYLIELEISRQFLGKLERVNWTRPLTEHSCYAAVMLLSDVRRRLHYEIKYVDLPEKIYIDARRDFEQVQAAIGVLGKLDIWGCGR